MWVKNTFILLGSQVQEVRRLVEVEAIQSDIDFCCDPFLLHYVSDVNSQRWRCCGLAAETAREHFRIKILKESLYLNSNLWRSSSQSTHLKLAALSHSVQWSLTTIQPRTMLLFYLTILSALRKKTRVRFPKFRRISSFFLKLWAQQKKLD